MVHSVEAFTFDYEILEVINDPDERRGVQVRYVPTGEFASLSTLEAFVSVPWHMLVNDEDEVEAFVQRRVINKAPRQTWLAELNPLPPDNSGVISSGYEVGVAGAHGDT